jgi:hypothetical protein
MSRRPEKHTLFRQSRFFLCAIALVCGCSLAPSETDETRALSDPVRASILDTAPAEDHVEIAACELEVDCCGNLNCAPAPCPIFCI